MKCSDSCRRGRIFRGVAGRSVEDRSPGCPLTVNHLIEPMASCFTLPCQTVLNIWSCLSRNASRPVKNILGRLVNVPLAAKGFACASVSFVSGGSLLLNDSAEGRLIGPLCAMTIFANSIRARIEPGFHNPCVRGSPQEAAKSLTVQKSSARRVSPVRRLVVHLPFSRQCGRIFLDTFAETTFHSCRQRHA